MISSSERQKLHEKSLHQRGIALNFTKFSALPQVRGHSSDNRSRRFDRPAHYQLMTTTRNATDLLINTDSTDQPRAESGPPPQGSHTGDLPRGEIDAILDRNHIGRIAYISDDRVDIEPIHYVYRYGWIYGRTSKGAKFEALKHQPRVAFEVSEVRGGFDWQSVVVKSEVEFLNPVSMPEMSPDDMAVQEDQSFSQAVALLRAFVPGSLTADDPAPDRYLTFRIHVDEVSGYSSHSASVA
jgi:hypothetical protein